MEHLLREPRLPENLPESLKKLNSRCHLRVNAEEAVSTWWPIRMGKKLGTRIGKTKTRIVATGDHTDHSDHKTIDPCRFYDAVDDAKVLEPVYGPFARLLVRRAFLARNPLRTRWQRSVLVETSRRALLWVAATFEKYVNERYFAEISWYDCKIDEKSDLVQNSAVGSDSSFGLNAGGDCVGSKDGLNALGEAPVTRNVSSGGNTCHQFKDVKFEENWVNYRTTCETLKREIHFFEKACAILSWVKSEKIRFARRVPSANIRVR